MLQTITTNHQPATDLDYVLAKHPASTRYAPLDRINTENFEELEIAWRL